MKRFFRNLSISILAVVVMCLGILIGNHVCPGKLSAFTVGAVTSMLVFLIIDKFE